MSLTSLLYQYLVGGLIFAVGIGVPWRAGDLSLKRKEDRRLLYSMVGAAVAYFVFQTAWHICAAGSGG